MASVVDEEEFIHICFQIHSGNYFAIIYDFSDENSQLLQPH